MTEAPRLSSFAVLAASAFQQCILGVIDVLLPIPCINEPLFSYNLDSIHPCVCPIHPSEP